ncbi:hypothetical protein [Bradyrhizobium sp.]|uniref:hypothetical protein n=1 Tax=Bradyrhizobium sp. TaxID=376 RepID=UPI002D63C3DC|nr:hypothetical protein [Bradyrhizobium sp.]HZR75131.1 hypothetical protein [Bradyrhizobium sp.]
MTWEAVLETVRRYRANASLCRQAAAFRPVQKISLLQQADDWERLALFELEGCFDQSDDAEECLDKPADPPIETRWWLPRREGLFANLESSQPAERFAFDRNRSSPTGSSDRP